MSQPASEPSTLRITVSGQDRPGVTSALLGGLAQIGADVLDLEQIVVRDHLTLSALLDPRGRADELAQAGRHTGDSLGMRTRISVGTGDSHIRPTGRAHVVVLGNPLDAGDLGAATERIARLGANIDRIRRLSAYPVTTVELDVSGADVPRLRSELATFASRRPIDIAVAPAGLARLGSRLVVMDVDSTLIQQEVIELLAAHAGYQAEVTAITEAAMRGELDFGESLTARVALLAGLEAETLDRVRAHVVLTPGARTLVRTLHRLGNTVALVSGGFAEVVTPIAADLGIDRVVANRLEIADGRLTGRIDGGIIDRAAKAKALRRFAADLGLPQSRTVAIGDGANDLDMLAAAGLGIAFNAKPLVQAGADTSVSVPYLDAVLFLLGVTREDVEEADAE
ncbi:MAG: phosphoserine phosphatase SerB [Actinomycetales bacterium]|nr:MAG: phosphoserine phosphatase SerB [Actinomycetales bacterium]